MIGPLMESCEVLENIEGFGGGAKKKENVEQHPEGSRTPRLPLPESNSESWNKTRKHREGENIEDGTSSWIRGY
ncbi:hypothetical protein HZH68_003030 [Vespula germanica]|uniref:Uncharacterized protein n=1 Tax=Vespula germanica TaxID=30212 RepID=A0A834NNJ4_VESGE|nr:hypothetical protein HZH68_003030 [Vespula germanica]